MANNDSVSTSIRYCFKRKEFVVRFPDSQLASEYQRANPEGRILLDQSSRDVYLPLPDMLSSIRASSQSGYSFVLAFDSARAASAWSNNAGLGLVSADDDYEVYVRREISKVGSSFIYCCGVRLEDEGG